MWVGALERVSQPVNRRQVMKRLSLGFVGMVGLMVAAMAMPALAQQGPGGQGPRRERMEQRGGPESGPGGRFNPEEMRQRMNERLKEQLKVSDEEWQALQPLIEKVQRLNMQVRMSAFGGMFGRGPGGPGGRGGFAGMMDTESSPVFQRASELRELLDDEGADASRIKSKLEAYRQARKALQEELAKAQEELRSVLTVRQEAVLVLMGLLD